MNGLQHGKRIVNFTEATVRPSAYVCIQTISAEERGRSLFQCRYCNSPLLLNVDDGLYRFSTFSNGAVNYSVL
jgi:hypothetical protein